MSRHGDITDLARSTQGVSQGKKAVLRGVRRVDDRRRARTSRYRNRNETAMEMNQFDRAIDLILAEEGGYVIDQLDPGGETKYGISKRAYPEINIPSLTPDQEKDIYMRDYWNPCKCEELPWPLSLLVFQAAINQETEAAFRWLHNMYELHQTAL